MTRRIPYIPQRVPVFVGCEGESEVGYVQLLNALAQNANPPVHLHVEKLIGAGDPLTRGANVVKRDGADGFKHGFLAFTEASAQAQGHNSNTGVKICTGRALPDSPIG